MCINKLIYLYICINAYIYIGGVASISIVRRKALRRLGRSARGRVQVSIYIYIYTYAYICIH